MVQPNVVFSNVINEASVQEQSIMFDGTQGNFQDKKFLSWLSVMTDRFKARKVWEDNYFSKQNA